LAVDVLTKSAMNLKSCAFDAWMDVSAKMDLFVINEMENASLKSNVQLKLNILSF
jgi:hypothetical protein